MQAPSAVAIQGGGSPVPERIIEVGRHYDASSNRSDMAAIRVLARPDSRPHPRHCHRRLLLPAGHLHRLRRPSRCRVPRVVRLRLAKARAKIRRAHCRVGRIRRVELDGSAESSLANRRARADGLHAGRGRTSSLADDRRAR